MQRTYHGFARPRLVLRCEIPMHGSNSSVSGCRPLIAEPQRRAPTCPDGGDGRDLAGLKNENSSFKKKRFQRYISLDATDVLQGRHCARPHSSAPPRDHCLGACSWRSQGRLVQPRILLDPNGFIFVWGRLVLPFVVRRRPNEQPDQPSLNVWAVTTGSKSKTHSTPTHVCIEWQARRCSQHPPLDLGSHYQTLVHN
jgi:hypothetical protein